ncbi:cupin domain-containing protein [Erwiniaceae bacterium CAU 1747]
MKVQKIEQPAAIESLEPCGSVQGLPGSPPIKVFGLEKKIPGKDDIDTGIFECSTGSYRRGVKQAEVMHILSGTGSFTPDGEEPVSFKGGDTLFFEADTQGTWVVETQMRKLYVIFDAK